MFLEMNESYRYLLDNVSDAIITTDLDDVVTSWNKSAEKIFGWKVAEALGKKLSALITPPGMQAEADIFIRDARSGKIYEGISTVRVHRNRITRINVRLSVFPIGDARQNTIGLSYILKRTTEQKLDGNVDLNGQVSISKDASTVTTNHRITEEMSIENKRFILASKVESEFIASLGHELRIPLNSIIGFSELLKQKTTGDLNKKQEQYVDKVLKSSKSLLNIIDDFEMRLIDAGKVQLVTEKISVLETLQEVIYLLKGKASSQKVVLKKELDPQLGVIEADKKWLKQILFNLLSNAVKFSRKDGGTVTITTKKAGDMVQFSVADNGIGIREEDIKKIFNKATGLGLVISKRLVELHGGSLTAESKYGAGSTFTFQLPLIPKKKANK